MSILVASILILGVHAQSPAPLPPASLANVRAAIEKKDTEKAVYELKRLYPAGLQRRADVQRVSQWMSLFLFDETVALYEKAVEMSAKKDAAAEDFFRKALVKEPHNKTLHQSLITHLIDYKKTKDALSAITAAEDAYPYFKVFSLYRRYLEPTKMLPGETHRAKAKGQHFCSNAPLSDDAVDFCRAVLLREDVSNKVRRDKKTIEEYKSIRNPEALYSLWEMTSSTEYLKQYVAKCQSRTDQEKRTDRLFPGVCSKVTDVEALLKTEDPEE